MSKEEKKPEVLRIESTDTKFLVRLVDWLSEAEILPGSTTLYVGVEALTPEQLSEPRPPINWRPIDDEARSGKLMLIRSATGLELDARFSDMARAYAVARWVAAAGMWFGVATTGVYPEDEVDGYCPLE